MTNKKAEFVDDLFSKKGWKLLDATRNCRNPNAHLAKAAMIVGLTGILNFVVNSLNEKSRDKNSDKILPLPDFLVTLLSAGGSYYLIEILGYGDKFNDILTIPHFTSIAMGGEANLESLMKQLKNVGRILVLNPTKAVSKISIIRFNNFCSILA